MLTRKQADKIRNLHNDCILAEYDVINAGHFPKPTDKRIIKNFQAKNRFNRYVESLVKKMKDIWIGLRFHYQKKGDDVMQKKKQVNVRLTERGIMKLEELRSYFGFNQSAMVELLITLQFEKIFLRKEEPPNEEKKCKLSG